MKSSAPIVAGSLLVVVLALLQVAATRSAPVGGPVIGIFTLPSTFDAPYDSQTYSYFGGAYVQYLESAGAQVVPIRYDYDEATVRYLLERVNGVLFPGGDPNLWVNETAMSGFSNMTLSAMRIIEWAKAQNDAGNYFPLWGTCLGYEILLLAVSNDSHVLDKFVQPNDSRYLTLEQEVADSKILRALSPDLIYYVQKYDVAYYAHEYGKLYSQFVRNARLSDFFTVDAVSQDERGAQFVALVEGKKYPFYGSQFHPEVQIFQNRPGLDTNHQPLTIQFSQELARFFVAESRKSGQHFEDFATFNRWSIYNYNPVISPDDFYDIVYFFRNVNVTGAAFGVR